MIWHGGFPLLVLGYALLQGPRWRPAGCTGSVGQGDPASVAGGRHRDGRRRSGSSPSSMTILPTLLSGGRYTVHHDRRGVDGMVLSLAALLVLWFRRPHSVIDVWLMVVLCAWLFDIALSAIVNVARFDLGFYVGRIYGLCAASFVLAVLLVDNVALQAQLSRLLERAAPAGGAPTRDRHTERERLFSAVVESSNDAIITKTLDGTITGWNPAAERLFGFTAAEAVGQRIDIIVPPDRRAESARHPRSDRPRRSHRAITKPCGCTRTAAEVHVSLGVSPIRSAAGEIVGASKIARDISESKRTQQALQSGDRGAPAHLRDLAGPHPGDGYRGQFRSGQPEFPDASSAIEPSEMIGHSAIEFIHPDDLDNTRSGDALGAARSADAQLRDALRPQGRPGRDADLDGDMVGAGAAAFLRRPRPHRKAGRRSPIPAGPEDGRRRPVDRRRRPRLQQHPDRHHRHHRHPGRCRRRPPGARGDRQDDRRGRRARRQPDQASARLRPQAAAAAARGRRQCAGDGNRQAAASRRSASISRSARCCRKTRGQRWSIRTSSPPRSSIWR